MVSTYLSGVSYLATGGLGEPQSPFVHKRVLHVEVIGVVEDSNGITSLSLGDRSGVLVGHSRSTIFCDGSHSEWMWRGRRSSSESRRGENFRKAQIGALHTKKGREIRAWILV